MSSDQKLKKKQQSLKNKVGSLCVALNYYYFFAKMWQVSKELARLGPGLFARLVTMTGRADSFLISVGALNSAVMPLKAGASDAHVCPVLCQPGSREQPHCGDCVCAAREGP